MTIQDPTFVTDSEGARVGVLLGIEQYRELLEAVEEVEAIRAYDEAVAGAGDTMPFEQAIAEIEQRRRSK